VKKMMSQSTNETILAVLPTIRKLDDCLEWAQVFSQHRVIFIVIQDGDGPDINIPLEFQQACKDIHHLRWKDIDKVLAENNWIISRKDSAIRCFAWLWADKMGIQYDYLFTFDDDTKPLSKNHLAQHIENLKTPIRTMMYNTVPQFTDNSPFDPRGFLGEKIKVYISHGLWTNVPDFSAETQANLDGIYNWNLPQFRQEVPAGILYPMCGMNVCFRKEIAPLMYFGLMGQKPDGKGWNIGRWDDMFAGWLSKLWLDRINGGVLNGIPYCNHQRASNVAVNLSTERLWSGAPEIVKLLNLLPQFASQIDTKNMTDFVQSLKSKVEKCSIHKSEAINHFIKCLDAASIFCGSFNFSST
jgi:reversibly glycosylated polypeptide / UDP-arabinopyranose mutase